MTSEAEQSDGHSTDGTQCPVCGQEYVHHKKIGPDDSRESLRDDMTQCIRTYDGYPITHQRTKEVWVHSRTPTTISRVREGSRDRSGGLLKWLAGGENR